MKQVLADCLRADERILWYGHPAGIRLTDPAFRLKNVSLWSLAALFVASGLWYAVGYAPAAGIRPLLGFLIGALGAGLGGILFVTPFFARRSLELEVGYCLTNERLIAYRLKDGQLRIQGREYVDFSQASVEYLETGKANLYIGPATRMAHLTLLNEILPAHESDRTEPLTFISIVDVEGACRCFPSYIRVEGIARERAVLDAA